MNMDNLIKCFYLIISVFVDRHLQRMMRISSKRSRSSAEWESTIRICMRKLSLQWPNRVSHWRCSAIMHLRLSKMHYAFAYVFYLLLINQTRWWNMKDSGWGRHNSKIPFKITSIQLCFHFSAFESSIGCILSTAWLQIWWHLHGWRWHIKGNCKFPAHHHLSTLSNAVKIDCAYFPAVFFCLFAQFKCRFCCTLFVIQFQFTSFRFCLSFFLRQACLRMFLELDFVERFHIDYEVLCRWLLSVKKNYRNVTYVG